MRLAMKILLIANGGNHRVVDALYQTIAYLDAQGIEHVDIDVADIPDAAFPYADQPLSSIDERLDQSIDMIVTMGGDGTLIHSARLAYVLDVPILGANYGHLGFLTNLAENGVIPLLADALSDEIVHEDRVNLCIDVECEGDELQPPTTPRRFFALNEIAVARGAAGHIVDFSFAVSGDTIAKMRGDGLVISTATGSTAYALSAGGPLVGPLHRGMIVVPLVPHTLNSRAIVTEHHDVVEMSFEEGSASAREVALFADGDALEFERPVSRVIVRAGERPIRLMTRREETFYKQIAHTFFK